LHPTSAAPWKSRQLFASFSAIAGASRFRARRVSRFIALGLPDATLETMHGVYRKEYVEDLQDCRWSLDVTALVKAEAA
jgi:hypothetical protein